MQIFHTELFEQFSQSKVLDKIIFSGQKFSEEIRFFGYGHFSEYVTVHFNDFIN